MKKEMLINVLQPEECRIAILEDGVLEELYVERTSHESFVGNIYKGRIVNIEPSIQAAFVDFGVGRNGFLHVSDVEPAYYRHLEGQRGGGERRGRDRDRGRGPDRGRGRSGGRRGPRREPAEDLLDFGDEPMPAPAEFPPEESFGDVDTGSAEVGFPEEASPERHEERTTEDAGAAESEPRTRERRRNRVGPRRRREEPPASPERSEEAPGESYRGEEAPPEERTDDAGLTRLEHERPRPMDSAERRTEADDRLTPEINPPPISDDDLFFPRTRPTERTASSESVEPPPAPPRREVEREPEPFPERDEPPPQYQDETDEPRPQEEEPFDDRMPDFEDEVDRPARREPRRGRDRDRDRGRRPGGGRPGTGRPKPLIQDIFKRGQEVLVQVIKDGIGTKGPTLSTYISIPGRYLVLMPHLNRTGVSRKINDDDLRRKLRDLFNELQPPKGLGFIIRTAGMDRTKKELQRDLAYLARVWQVVVRRIRKMKAPAEIYQESDMITRTIRDTFTSEIETIWVDEPNAFAHAQEFLQIVMPRYATRIQHYDHPEPMFHRYGIEEEIARIQQRHVPLPTGGSIVIEQTEALVAIDVNSGNFRADNNAEETAYQMNLQAAREIARQLRLRDLGGVIVNDFIDMRDEKHKRGVERALRDAIRRDRARTKILKMSAFGIIEMTRQRVRPSLKRSVYQDCAHCVGTGQVKTCESMSIEVMRLLQLAAHREQIHRVDVGVAPDVANYLANKKRKEIAKLEESGEIAVHIQGTPGAAPEQLEFRCYDNNNNEVKFLPYDEDRPRRR